MMNTNHPLFDPIISVLVGLGYLVGGILVALYGVVIFFIFARLMNNILGTTQS